MDIYICYLDLDYRPKTMPDHRVNRTFTLVISIVSDGVNNFPQNKHIATLFIAYMLTLLMPVNQLKWLRVNTTFGSAPGVSWKR